MLKYWAFVIFIAFPAYLVLSKKYDEAAYWDAQHQDRIDNGPPGWL